MMWMAATTLPLACEHAYYPDFLPHGESRVLVAWLREAKLATREIRMADGTRFQQSLGVYLFADEDLLDFGSLPEAFGPRAAWPARLRPVKQAVESLTGHPFHVGRLVHYRDGSDEMAYHSDLPAYGDTTWIASLSLGAERSFSIRRKDNEREIHSLVLAEGSLFVMGEGFQELYEHAVPADSACAGDRFNLTFRRFGWE